MGVVWCVCEWCGEPCHDCDGSWSIEYVGIDPGEITVCLECYDEVIALFTEKDTCAEYVVHVGTESQTFATQEEAISSELVNKAASTTPINPVFEVVSFGYHTKYTDQKKFLAHWDGMCQDNVRIATAEFYIELIGNARGFQAAYEEKEQCASIKLQKQEEYESRYRKKYGIGTTSDAPNDAQEGEANADVSNITSNIVSSDAPSGEADVTPTTAQCHQPNAKRKTAEHTSLNDDNIKKRART